jgi:hypothetical protein
MTGERVFIAGMGVVSPLGAGVAEIGGMHTTDAFHPVAPQPEGQGACWAVRSALEDAGLAVSDIEVGRQ